MLIGTFTLIMALLGGNDSPFVLPKAEKAVKQIIVDSDKKKEILAEMKVYSKEWKKLQKTKKKQAKAIAKLNKDYSVDQQLMADGFRIYLEEREPIISDLNQFRLSVQDKFSEEEWGQLMDRAINISPKKTKKLDKTKAKAEISQNKQLAAIASEIQSAFSDPAKIKSADEYFLAFEDAMAEMLVRNQDYLPDLIEVMEDQGATKAELTAIANQEEQIRAAGRESFLTLRKNLVDLSNENDWPKLAKALGKFIQ